MSKGKILIVEDNVDNLALVRFLLERAGYSVLTALNGREALQVAQQELPDLILMDMALPEMDGWSATRELKAIPETQHIPVVALTAYTLPGDRRKAQDAGCDGFIAKPMNVSGFHKEIESFLSGKSKT